MAHEHIPNLTSSSVRRLALSLGITLVFVVIEILAGVFANSLALLTDAAHNLTDVLALALTWWALWITTKPADSSKTYGYHRAGILVALVNSTTLAVIALGIFYEAWKRIVAPPIVQADILIGVGAAAVVVNLATALLVRRGSEQDLNLRSAFLHLMGDVLSTVGAVIAGIIIRFTGWNWLDALVSILIGFLILWNAWGILRESLEILMESTPADINLDTLRRDMLAVEGVRGVHDLHIWSINRSLRTLSAHVITDDVPVSVGAKVRAAVGQMLADRYEVRHATLQLECIECDNHGLFCDSTDPNV
ncbi:MAG TPA: cation diffusion facilitator family transporter [Anaerolineales bacterium]